MKKNQKILLSVLIASFCIGNVVSCNRNTPSNNSEESVNSNSSTPSVDDSTLSEVIKETLSYDAGNRFAYPRSVIKRFDYNGVKLSNDSAFKQEFNYAMEYLLQIPTDDLLKVMRIREGKDVEGSSYLGGWYDGGLWVAATFGQYVSSLARGYALTKDERLKAKATELLDGWADCISEDGFFYFSPDRNTNSTHYTYDKVVLMCLDVYTYIGDEIGQRALTYLKTATNFAKDYLGQKRINATPTGPHSGQSVEGGNSDIEWYILSENLYRAYLATGDEYYKQFGDVWNYDYFWNALKNGDGSKYHNVHAYSHTNSISGAAMKYALTGDVHYLEVVNNAYYMYQGYEVYPNGLYGSYERLVGTVGNLNDTIEADKANSEVPCDTWAALKIVKYLTELTGESTYYSWGEKLLYNGVLSMLPMSDDSIMRGKTFYYASYQKDAVKEYYAASWPCCSGTYFMNLCDVADQLYYYDEDSLYVANYVSSQVESNFNDRNVILTQGSDFPNSNTVKMTVNCTKNVDFNLKIRIPEWSETIKVLVNGKDINAKLGKEPWLNIGDSFNNNDKIEITFNPKLDLQQIVEGDNGSVMAMYGSIYMVAEKPENRTITLNENKEVSDYIVGKDKNTIYVRDENDILFKFVPYYELGVGAEYAGNLSVVYREEA